MMHTMHFLPEVGGGIGWETPIKVMAQHSLGGCGFSLLNFIEQNNLYNSINDGNERFMSPQQFESAAIACATPVPIYFCPSRRSPGVAPRLIVAPTMNGYAHNSDPTELEARNDYAANGGANVTLWNGGSSLIDLRFNRGFSDMSAATGISFQRSEIGFGEVSDGTSNTYMMGEKYIAVEHYMSGEDAGDDQNFMSGDDVDLHRWTAEPPMKDQQGVSNVFIFGSAHPGGFNMGFVDGSTHFVNYSISPEAHRLMGSRSDGNVVPVQ